MSVTATNSLPDIIRKAGVVGAGGAGFPSYVKAASRAEIVVMNAAECEPLLHKDIELLEHYARQVLEGMQLVIASTGAKKGIIGIKKKHGATIKLLEGALKGHPNIEICPMGDFYPAGDEYCMVYEVTGRLIPPGGLPIEVGVVVNNVETFYNISQASKFPVTHTFTTVCGAVKKPITLRLPLGMSFAEAIALAGGATCSDPAAIDGGPMMGRVITDFSEPVTKTTAGIIVLPKTHPLIIKKAADRPVYSKIGRSACDQCSYCTMLCPRYLLGYQVEPHKVMRSLLFADSSRKVHSESGLLCCECSLCSLYSCPEDLDPRNMCVSAKKDLRQMNVNFKNSAIAGRKGLGVHPVRDFRKVPVSRLVQKLGLTVYKKDAPLSSQEVRPSGVRILLAQHIGVPAAPVVSAGQKVSAGQLIADVPQDKLGVALHASISGTVSAVTDKYIQIDA